MPHPRWLVSGTATRHPRLKSWFRRPLPNCLHRREGVDAKLQCATACESCSDGARGPPRHTRSWRCPDPSGPASEDPCSRHPGGSRRKCRTARSRGGRPDRACLSHPHIIGYKEQNRGPRRGRRRTHMPRIRRAPGYRTRTGSYLAVVSTGVLVTDFPIRLCPARPTSVVADQRRRRRVLSAHCHAAMRVAWPVRPGLQIGR